jgi:hypothetical protein
MVALNSIVSADPEILALVKEYVRMKEICNEQALKAGKGSAGASLRLFWTAKQEKAVAAQERQIELYAATHGLSPDELRQIKVRASTDRLLSRRTTSMEAA